MVRFMGASSRGGVGGRDLQVAESRLHDGDLTAVNAGSVTLATLQHENVLEYLEPPRDSG